MVVVQMSNSFSYFTSRHSSAQVKDLLSDLVGDLISGLSGQEGVVKVVSASVYLHIVQVVGVDGGQADAAVVHLSGEDFIAEEVVTENAAVRVSVVLGVGSGDIDEVAQEGVHGVVLLLDIIQVLSVLVDSV